jgi:hypothetical protein
MREMAAAVERGGGGHLARRRHEVGDVPADAEADRAHAVAAHVGARAQERHRGARVVDHLARLQLGDELHPLLHALLVVGELDPRRGAVVVVGRQRHVTLGGDAVDHRPDVRVHAEDLLEHQHRGEAARLVGHRVSQVAAHLLATDGDRHLLALGPHALLL